MQFATRRCLMSSLFVLTFMFSTPAFCLGLVNPQWVGLATRKLSVAVYGVLMVASFVSVGLAAPKPPQPVSSLLTSTEWQESRVITSWRWTRGCCQRTWLQWHSYEPFYLLEAAPDDRLDRDKDSIENRKVVLDLHAPTASVINLAVFGDRNDLKRDDRSAKII